MPTALSASTHARVMKVNPSLELAEKERYNLGRKETPRTGIDIAASIKYRLLFSSIAKIMLGV